MKRCAIIRLVQERKEKAGMCQRKEEIKNKGEETQGAGSTMKAMCKK